MFSRWGKRTCMRYLEWFLSGTLRGSLKFASSTPMRGFRYFLKRSLTHHHTVSPQEQVDIMMCEGFSGHQLISQLHDHTVLNNSNISNEWVPSVCSLDKACLPGRKCLFERPAEICYCWAPCYCWALSAWGVWWIPPGKLSSFRSSPGFLQYRV